MKVTLLICLLFSMSVFSQDEGYAEPEYESVEEEFVEQRNQAVICVNEDGGEDTIASDLEIGEANNIIAQEGEGTNCFSSYQGYSS